MIKTYTVRDPDNPDVLLDVDVIEEEEEEQHYKKRSLSPIRFKVEEKGADEIEPRAQKDFLLSKYRHVYNFVCMYAAAIGIYTIEKLFRDAEKTWQNQLIFDEGKTKTKVFVPENSAEVLEQTLNGVYYGVLQSAYISVNVFRTRRIGLEHIIDCLKADSNSDPKVVEMFLKYAVTRFKAGNVAGFSAQPGRVYTKNGSVALNVHAGTAHRQEVQQQLNMFLIWFQKVKPSVYVAADGTETVTLSIVDLRTGGLEQFAQVEMRRAGVSADPKVKIEVSSDDDDDLVLKKSKK